ncbi:MAG: TIGR00282 family metallophosphoesterase [Planctomycetota bacterium]
MPAEPTAVRILLIGDIVGRPGRRIVREPLPALRERWRLDLVVANAENAASGSGITPRLYRDLRSAGIDLMTLGDHAWKRKDNLEVLGSEERLLRPHNYPIHARGTGAGVVETSGGIPVAVVTVLGRVFMEPVDCPFRAIDRALEALDPGTRIRLVEFHAEATSEKIAAGWHLDGRVSCVFGTHTHVPTADDRVLPEGTAYITDLGMTGPYDGIIGREKKAVLHKFLTSMHASFTVADGNTHLCGALLDVDPESGRALDFRRVDLIAGEDGEPYSLPAPLQSISDLE